MKGNYDGVMDLVNLKYRLMNVVSVYLPPRDVKSP